MLTPFMGNRLAEGQTWAADTGCYAQPEKYSNAVYWKWLEKRDPMSCLFATAPDVVGDAAATLTRSKPMFKEIHALEYPVAFVAQDGIETIQVPWADFDCLFIGGSTKFKLGLIAERYIQEAKARGKWVHVGRVNSGKRFRRFRQLRVDSVDGTYLVWGPDINTPKLKRWVDGENRQGCL